METVMNTKKNNLEARVSQEDVVKVYNKMAGIYDIWALLTETRARDRAIELAGIEDGQAILEVAVGTGLGFYEMVKRNPNGTNYGIDLTPKMLAKAKRRMERSPFSNYLLQPGNAFNLDFDDNSIDLLMNNYMFDLIPYPEMDSIIQEFRRVLKPNGKLLLVNMTRAETPGSRIYEMIYKVSPKTMGGCRGIQLQSRLEDNGFNVQTREYYQQMLFPSEVLMAIK
jgi:ubiquinone/menaquinone biosynthesis C-methylase UbiE